MTAGIPQGTLHRAFHFVLTTPETQNSLESEVATLKFLKSAKTGLRRKLNAIRKTKSGWIPLVDYLVGLHSKPREDSRSPYPHIHLVLRLGAECDAGRIEQEVIDYWHKVTTRHFHLPARVITKVKGDMITRDKSREGKSGWIYIEHFENLLAYAMRLTEGDDTPESLAHRYMTFRIAGLGRHFSRARFPGIAINVPTKSHFNPVALGKEYIAVFAVGREHPYILPAECYQVEREKLTQQSHAFVYGRIPKSIRKEIK